MERVRAAYAVPFAALVAIAGLPGVALAQGGGAGGGNPPAESITKRGGTEYLWLLLVVAAVALVGYVLAQRRGRRAHRL
jgi:hypothetical protein